MDDCPEIGIEKSTIHTFRHARRGLLSPMRLFVLTALVATALAEFRLSTRRLSDPIIRTYSDSSVSSTTPSFDSSVEDVALSNEAGSESENHTDILTDLSSSYEIETLSNTRSESDKAVDPMTHAPTSMESMELEVANSDELLAQSMEQPSINFEAFLGLANDSHTDGTPNQPAAHYPNGSQMSFAQAVLQYDENIEQAQEAIGIQPHHF